jgi:hypothetical protein
VGLTSRTSEKAKRKNIEIIRIFKAWFYGQRI